MNYAKEYLNQIRDLDAKIKQRQQDVEELRTAAMSSGSLQLDANRIRTDSPDPDPLASKVGRYVDIEKEIGEMLLELTELKHTIIGQIQMLGDQKYTDVLWKRYVELESFAQIASEMGYNVRHVTRIHGRALQMFNDYFDFERCP